MGLLSLILVGLLAFFLRSVSSFWAVNQWSLTFVQNSAEIELVVPPPMHQRAPIWLALRALAQEDLAKVDVWLPALKEKSGKDELAARTLGEILWAQGDIDGAIEVWVRIGDYHILSGKALQAKSSNQLDIAEKAFYAAYDVEPEAITLTLVNFLRSHKKYSEAETLVRTILDTFPHSSRQLTWRRMLGDILRDQQMWNEAESTFQQLLEEYPEDWNTYIKLGWVYYERGDDIIEVVETFKKAIALEPKQGDGYAAIGALLVKEQRYTDADYWYIQAVQHEPNVKGWWLARANAARSSGDIQKSLDLYLGTINQFPDWSPAYYRISYTYQLTDSPELAIAMIEKAIELDENNRLGYFFRAGDIYEWVDDIPKAIWAYDKVLRIDPDNARAERALERLGTSD